MSNATVRSAALINTFGPVARALTRRRDVELKISGQGGSSHTDGTGIFLHANQNALMEVLANNDPGLTNLMAVSGSFYHEVCHLLYTDWSGEYFQWVQDNYMHPWSNLLDDQRIENFFVAIYEPARDYFVNMITNIVLGGSSNEFAWYLIAGRYYLPNKLRAKAKGAVIDVHKRDESSAIIDAFCALEDFEGDNAKLAINLTQRFADLHQQPAGQTCTSGEATTEAGKQREPMRGQVPQVLQEDGQEASEGQGSQEGEEGQEEGQGGAEKPQSATATEADHSGGKFALDDVARKTQSEAQDRLRSGGDLKRRSSTMRHNEQNYTTQGAAHTMRSHDWTTPQRRAKPGPELIAAANRMSLAFEHLRGEVDSGWVPGAETGRLNTELASQSEATGSSEIFDDWYEGVQDATDIEAVLLLDCSDSMSHRMEAACEALWALHTSLHRAQATLTVIGFSTKYGTIVDRGTSPGPQVNYYAVRDYTNVRGALKEALTILGVSKRTVKLFFVVTDGAIHDREDARQLFDGHPHHYGMIGIGSSATYVTQEWQPGPARPGLLFSRTIDNAFELATIINRATVDLARERALRGVA